MVFDEGLESGHKQEKTVAEPEYIDGVGLDILNAPDEEVLYVGFGVLQNHEDEAGDSGWGIAKMHFFSPE